MAAPARVWAASFFPGFQDICYDFREILEQPTPDFIRIYRGFVGFSGSTNDLTVAEVKNKFRTLTQGKNSEKVLGLMANTFKALVDYAEWTPEAKKNPSPKPADQKASDLKQPKAEEATTQAEEEDNSLAKLRPPQLHYNIQIHLPESRDQAVYDAIFNSLKKHLF